MSEDCLHTFDYWGRDETEKGKMKIVWRCSKCEIRKHSKYKILNEFYSNGDIPI